MLCISNLLKECVALVALALPQIEPTLEGAAARPLIKTTQKQNLATLLQNIEQLSSETLQEYAPILFTKTTSEIDQKRIISQLNTLSSTELWPIVTEDLFSMFLSAQSEQIELALLNLIKSTGHPDLVLLSTSIPKGFYVQKAPETGNQAWYHFFLDTKVSPHNKNIVVHTVADGIFFQTTSRRVQQEILTMLIQLPDTMLEDWIMQSLGTFFTLAIDEAVQQIILDILELVSPSMRLNALEQHLATLIITTKSPSIEGKIAKIIKHTHVAKTEKNALFSQSKIFPILLLFIQDAQLQHKYLNIFFTAASPATKQNTFNAISAKAIKKLLKQAKSIDIEREVLRELYLHGKCDTEILPKYYHPTTKNCLLLKQLAANLIQLTDLQDKRWLPNLYTSSPNNAEQYLEAFIKLLEHTARELKAPLQESSGTASNTPQSKTSSMRVKNEYALAETLLSCPQLRTFDKEQLLSFMQSKASLAL